MLGLLLGLAAVAVVSGAGSKSDFIDRDPSDLTPSEREIRRRQIERERQKREEEARHRLGCGNW